MLHCLLVRPGVPGSPVERLPGWPREVAETLENEQKTGLELQQLIMAGKVHLNTEDESELRSLASQANRAFRMLRYPDYIRAVEARQTLVNRYKTAANKP